MERIFEYDNGTIYVTLPETCDKEKLRKVTEDFLKKVMYGRDQNGNSNTRTNFRKE